MERKKSELQAVSSSRVQPTYHSTEVSYMVPKIMHKINIFSIDFWDGIELYTHTISEMDLFQIECNWCHRHGHCIRYGFYDRAYIIRPDNLNDRIDIQRVLCKACHKTHGILPEVIVPYAQFSIVFMFLVLYQYFLGEKTVEAICAEFNIAPHTLFQWKKVFLQQKDIFLGVLESGKYTAIEALSWIKNQSAYAHDFVGPFLRKTEHMPMQTHRNPSNTRRPVLA